MPSRLALIGSRRDQAAILVDIAQRQRQMKSPASYLRAAEARLIHNTQLFIP